MYSGTDVFSILLKILAAASVLAGLSTFILDLRGIKLSKIPPKYMKPFGVGLFLIAIIFGFIDYFSTRPKPEVSKTGAISIQANSGSIHIGTIIKDVQEIGQLTIHAGDPPEVRQQKIERAKHLIASEILANISSIDAQVGFVEESLIQNNFNKKLKGVREKVAPAIEQASESGYHRLIYAQKVASLRQALNSRPLRIEFGEPLIRLLIKSEIDSSPVRFFYDQLANVNWASESLLRALSDSAAVNSVDTPSLREHQNRIIALNVEVLRNRSLIAHISGLRVLNSLVVKIPEINFRLAKLTYLKPRHVIKEKHAQELLKKYMLRIEELVIERKALVKEAQHLRDQALDRYRKINEQLVIKPTDTWSEVVGKALSLRQLGRTTEAVSVFSQYGEMFAETDPTAKRYARTAQQFTLQIENLGVKGGVYIYELVNTGGAMQAGLQIGDIVINYSGQIIKNMDDIVTALRNAPVGEPVRVVYLRMGNDGHFTRRTTTVIGGPMGAGFMPI